MYRYVNAESDVPERASYLPLEDVKTEIEKSWNPRSAFEKGVKSNYVPELFETMADLIEYEGLDGVPTDLKSLKDMCLNGASDWNQYSWGGSSFVYDGDIAENLCTPSELKRTRNGELPPNRNEEWLDVQARALNSAFRHIWSVVQRMSSRRG